MAAVFADSGYWELTIEQQPSINSKQRGLCIQSEDKAWSLAYYVRLHVGNLLS